jgi:hypothetical protein
LAFSGARNADGRHCRRIKIRFYNDDHPPAHFHATFAEHEAGIEIGNLTVVEGSLPKAQMRKVQDWASMRQDQLIEAWNVCQADRNPGKIT